MKHLILLTIAYLVGYLPLVAQPSLTGTVSDTSGQPIPGVNIIEKGTTNGTVTDVDGHFHLTTSEADATLVFSFIGYQTVEVPLSGQTAINLTMQEDLQQLSAVEVYATGYQEIPAERATGSFEQIDHELLNRSVSTDVLSRLNGVTPGLLFNSSNISDESMTIRGRATLLGAAAAEPLIVLDNFPYEGDLQSINPNDIESITVLKDAAAASIWGARAGNGVIVITSKQGSLNTPLQVSFNANTTIQAQPDLFYNQNYLTSPEYIEVERYLFDQGYYEGLLSSAAQPALTPVVQLLDQQRRGELTDQSLEEQLQRLSARDVRQDFEDHIYRPAVNQQYAIDFQGGSDELAYQLSLGYDHHSEALQNNTMERFTTAWRNTFTPIRHLDVSFGFNYSQTRTETPNDYAYGSATTAYMASNALYPYADLTQPIEKDFNTNYKDSLTAHGLLDWHYRPLEEVGLNDRTTTTSNLLMNAQLHYKLTPQLSLIGQYQRQQQSTTGRQLSDAASYDVRNQVNRYASWDEPAQQYTFPFPEGDILRLQQSELRADNLRAQLTYNQQLANRHVVNALGGVELRETVTEGFSRTSLGYDDELGTAVTNLDYQTNYPVRPYGIATLPAPAGAVAGTTNRYLSQFANAAYTYDRRYTVSASARRDGANIFGVNTNDKITPLWSTGIAWNLSNEPFFQVDWLPFLKLRSTYGFNGNVYNASAYLTATYRTSSLTGLPTASVTSPPNPELRWERVKNINVGLDFELRKQLLSGTIAWYQKDGMDLIEEAPLPLSTGFTSFRGNAASVRTQGLDLQLTSHNINQTFQWQTTWMLNITRDKVTHFDPEYTASNLVSGKGNGSGSLIAVPGKPLFGLYSYGWAGLNEQGEPQGYVEGQASSDYLSVLNNASPDSLVFHGSARPVTFGALRNTFSWKAWSLSLNLTYKLGYFFRRTSISPNYVDVIQGMAHADYAQRWQQPGDEHHTSVPALVYPADVNRSNFYRYAEVLVAPADHIRLQDIRLAYTTGNPNTNRLPFSQLQVYLYVSNLGILWRANEQGLDPDFNNAQRGVASYPNPLSAALGLKASF